MAKLKTIVKWVGLTIGTLVTVVWLVNSDLINILLPVRTLFPILLLTAGLLLFLRPSKITIPVAFIYAALGVFIFISGRAGFTEETISFENAGVVLEGTLYSPEGAGPFPAVVFVQGSPCISRRLYHAYAEHLVLNDVMVLSFDKRGTGNSGGICNQENNTGIENLSLLAGDIIAGIEAIKTSPKVDPRRLGVWGLSQAGWVAPLVAEKYPELAFMVIISGPTVSVGEEQYYSQISGDSNLLARDPSDGDKADNLVESTQPSMFNPYPLLEKINIPGLWVYGGMDGSIPVKKNIKLLKILQAAGKPYNYLLYPDGTHIMIELYFPYNFSEGFQDKVANWIKFH